MTTNPLEFIRGQAELVGAVTGVYQAFVPDLTGKHVGIPEAVLDLTNLRWERLAADRDWAKATRFLSNIPWARERANRLATWDRVRIQIRGAWTTLQSDPRRGEGLSVLNRWRAVLPNTEALLPQILAAFWRNPSKYSPSRCLTYFADQCLQSRPDHFDALLLRAMTSSDGAEALAFLQRVRAARRHFRGALGPVSRDTYWIAAAWVYNAHHRTGLSWRALARVSGPGQQRLTYLLCEYEILRRHSQHAMPIDEHHAAMALLQKADCLERLHERLPTDHEFRLEVLMQRAETLRALGQETETIAAYRESLTVEDLPPSYLLHITFVLAELLPQAEAIRVFQDAARSLPNGMDLGTLFAGEVNYCRERKLFTHLFRRCCEFQMALATDERLTRLSQAEQQHFRAQIHQGIWCALDHFSAFMQHIGIGRAHGLPRTNSMRTADIFCTILVQNREHLTNDQLKMIQPALDDYFALCSPAHT